MPSVRSVFAPDNSSPSLKPLLLGSRSPRRAELLARAGFVFTAFDPPYADPANPNDAQSTLGGPALAEQLAQRKAASVLAGDLPKKAVLLTADTLVVAPDGGLLGTPETAAEAADMLRVLRDATHVIATGVCLRDRVGDGEEETESFVATALVTFGSLDDAMIEAYVAGAGWQGKAGGYNLEERLHDGWPVTVVGEPEAVMGLPLAALIPRLVARGIHPLEASLAGEVSHGQA